MELSAKKIKSFALAKKRKLNRVGPFWDTTYFIRDHTAKIVQRKGFQVLKLEKKA